MPYRVYLVEPPSLLEDLLEASARVFHHHCAIIQQVFHDQWLRTLGDHIGAEQIAHPNDRPTAVESRVRQRLRSYRQDLRARRDEMLADEAQKQARRDEAICAYVAALPETRHLAAA